MQLLNGPATQFIAATPPFGLGAIVTSPANKFDRNTALTVDPKNHIVSKGVSGQIDYNFEFAKLTSITAYRDQRNQSAQDVDFTAAALSDRVDNTHAKTFTQEVRLASNGDGPFNWLIGGFYDHEDLDTRSTINFGPGIRTYADGLSGQVPAALLGALPAALRPALAGRSNIYALEFLQSLVTPSIQPGATYFQAGQAVTAPYTLEQDSYSIFGQADFKLTDRLTITGGVAYLDDRKKSSANVVLTDPFSRLDLQNVPQFTAIGLPGNLYGALGALQFFYGNAPTHGPVNYPNANESGILKGDKVTYLGRANYDFGPVNVYASYSTGWKAGAYNLSTERARANQRRRPDRGAGERRTVRGRRKGGVPGRLPEPRGVQADDQGLPVERLHRHRLQPRQRRPAVGSRRRDRFGLSSDQLAQPDRVGDLSGSQIRFVPDGALRQLRHGTLSSQPRDRAAARVPRPVWRTPGGHFEVERLDVRDHLARLGCGFQCLPARRI